MSIAEDLQNLSFEGAEDIEVGEDYVDPSVRTLLPEGDYLLQLEGVALDKDKDGKIRFPQSGPYPTVVIDKAIVAAPDALAGKIAFFGERVYSVPFERNGQRASGLADFTRSMDQTRTWRKLAEGVELAAELANSGAFAKAKLTWEAYDKEYFDQLVADAGGESLVSAADKKKFRKDATIKGMKKFKQLPDGSYAPEVEGKSGNILEARARVATWYPSSKTLNI